MISTYFELKDRVSKFAHRSDDADMLDTFIDMAEAEMYSNQYTPLRTQGMEVTQSANLSTSSRFLAFPAGYLQVRSMKLKEGDYLDNDVDLKYKVPDQMAIDPNDGTPVYYTVTDQFEFDRVPDQTYDIDIIHYAKVDSLSDTTTSNAVLTNYPSVYLFGCLWAYHLWSMKPEAADAYYARFISAIRGANKNAQRQRYGNAPKVRVRGVIP